MERQKSLRRSIRLLKEYHMEVLKGLFEDSLHPVYAAVGDLFDDLGDRLAKDPTLNYDYDYDQLICYGELLSTTIICHF